MPMEQRNKKLCCEYHRECGYTTRNCRELKRALDELADEGKLNQYLKNSPKEHQGRKIVQEVHSPANNNISINVIIVGYAPRGLSNRVRKSHLRSLEE
uniref:Uncharacterized protein n=1 Tax=Chenopodium quinoa TaxID=63459 RepID=A0A803NAJ2_CHEQI